MIFLTATDKNREVHNFACGLDSLETCFDFLNEVVAGGDTLLSAYVVDQLDVQKRTELPLDAFDGTSCSVDIQALQHEWQSIINPADPPLSRHQETMAQLIQRRLEQYQLMMTSSERMITYFENLLYRTNDGFLKEPIRERLTYQYELSIERYRKQFATARYRSLLATNQLSRLQL